MRHRPVTQISICNWPVQKRSWCNRTSGRDSLGPCGLNIRRHKAVLVGEEETEEGPQESVYLSLG